MKIETANMKIKSEHDLQTYLYSKRAKGMKLGLDHITQLLNYLDHPEQQFPAVHIAGTNGKGSTAAILESILREAGYKTGLYTSPHLIDIRERIRINGQFISKKEMIDLIGALQIHFEASQASFFECLTASAYRYFADHQIDIAVLETGLGGRLDATTLNRSILTLITEIGLDHTHILGRRTEIIAGEKAGILKSGIPCIVGRQSESVIHFFSDFCIKNSIPVTFLNQDAQIRDIQCSSQGSVFSLKTDSVFYQQLRLSLLGAHQIDNAAQAVLAVEKLKQAGWQVPEKAIRSGLQNAFWPARIQQIHENPTAILDSAHNPLGMQRLVESIQSLFRYDHLILVFGVLKDKQYDEMISIIAPLAGKIVLTRPLGDRALDPSEIQHHQAFSGKPLEVIPDISAAWDRAFQLAGRHDLICGAGSIYFVGEILKSIQTEWT